MIATALAGCAKIPLSTQWKLRSFRIETANLSSLRVAARGPTWLTPTPNAGSIVLTYWREGEEGAKKAASLRLRRASYAEDESLARIAESGPLSFYEIDPRDRAAAAAVQEVAKRMKNESGSPLRGEVTIDRAACRNGAIPSGPIPVDLFVHTDDDIGWLPFFRGYDLRPDPAHEAEFMEKFAEHVPPCGKLSNRLGQTGAQK
jgi:hypothetical protein